mmetsp:Transcript_74637/g.242496  ORF Transcript_74637/g.242496 Transcript_74637/m.242496 type:complete len:202 (-) Transcript_74637:8-613(-)
MPRCDRTPKPGRVSGSRLRTPGSSSGPEGRPAPGHQTRRPWRPPCCPDRPPSQEPPLGPRRPHRPGRPRKARSPPSRHLQPRNLRQPPSRSPPLSSSRQRRQRRQRRRPLWKASSAQGRRRLSPPATRSALRPRRRPEKQPRRRPHRRPSPVGRRSLGSAGGGGGAAGGGGGGGGGRSRRGEATGDREAAGEATRVGADRT